MSPGIINPHVVGAGVFSPKSVSGLLAWYSAEAETGATNNVRLPTWHDQSGLGNNAAQFGNGGAIWKSTSGSAGGPALNFDGTGWYDLPFNLMLGATAGEVFINLIQTPATNTGLWAFGEASGVSDESHYPFSGTVYEAFGLRTGNRQTFAFAGTGSWHTYNVWAANNDFSANIDGVAKVASSSIGATGWVNPPRIGVGQRNIGTDLKFTGNVTTVILFNRKLTSTERTNILTFMTANPSGGMP